jgi:hypothetical protein
MRETSSITEKLSASPEELYSLELVSFYTINGDYFSIQLLHSELGNGDVFYFLRGRN